MAGQVIICTLGTRGDILPFLVLAEPFQAAGYDITFLTNSNWQDLIEEAGLKFRPIAPSDPPQDGRDNYEFFRSNIYPSFQQSFDIIEKEIQHCRRPTILYRAGMLGAEMAAQRYSLAKIKVVLQPSSILSIQRPPWPWAGLATGPWSYVSKAILLPLFFWLTGVLSGYRRLGNKFRRRVGIAPLRWWQLARNDEDLCLLLCPEWFSTPQKDWPRATRAIGFPYPSASSLPSAVLEFLDGNGMPLIFTAGTGIQNARSFFRDAIEVSRLMRLPAILVGKVDLTIPEDMRNSVIAWPYLDFGSLLPYGLALIHHGGIGTVAQAIRAGIPQIITPVRFDQPDNAMRVAVFGLGGAIFKKNTTPIETAAVIRSVLENSEIEKQLRIAALNVRGNECARKAFELIQPFAGANRKRLLTEEAVSGHD